MGHLLKIKCVDLSVNVHIFSFNKFPIYNHDGASAKFSTNSHETENRVGGNCRNYCRSTLYTKSHFVDVYCMYVNTGLNRAKHF
jgi:hypothetical protein